MGQSHLVSVHWKWRTYNSKVVSNCLGDVGEPCWGNDHRNKENKTES